MLHLAEYLKLLQDTRLFLAQNPHPVLSDPADCEFFRQKFKESLARKKSSPPKQDTKQSIYDARSSLVNLEDHQSSPSSMNHSSNLSHSEALKNSPNLTARRISPPPAPSEILRAPLASPPEAPVQDPQQPTLTPPMIQPIAPAPIHKTPPVESKVTPVLPAQDSPYANCSPLGMRESSLQWPVLSLGKWKTVMSKAAPELHILTEVPSDAMALKIASRWKTKNLSAPITLLSYQEIPEQKALLEQITLALDVHFCPTKLVSAETIEKEQQWETFLSVDELRLIITCDYTLWQMPGLLKFYKDSPSRRQIGEKDLFLLPDLSLYLKDPLLKRSLWKALYQVSERSLNWTHAKTVANQGSQRALY